MDAGSSSYWVLLSSARSQPSSEPTVVIVIACEGKPLLGYQSRARPGCTSARTTISRQGVEWVGISGTEGTFVLEITSVRTSRVGNKDLHEVHGVLDVTVPVSNTFDPPVTFKATF